MMQACVGCQGHTIRGHDGTLSAVVSHPTHPNGLVTPGECQLARPRRLGGMMFLLRALVSTLFLSPQHKKKEKIHMVNKEGSDPLHRTTTHNPSDRRLRRIKWYEPPGMQWALRRRYLSPPLPSV